MTPYKKRNVERHTLCHLATPTKHIHVLHTLTWYYVLLCFEFAWFAFYWLKYGNIFIIHSLHRRHRFVLLLNALVFIDGFLLGVFFFVHLLPPNFCLRDSMCRQQFQTYIRLHSLLCDDVQQCMNCSWKSIDNYL